jgi:hypothetical protein
MARASKEFTPMKTREVKVYPGPSGNRHVCVHDGIRYQGIIAPWGKGTEYSVVLSYGPADVMATHITNSLVAGNYLQALQAYMKYATQS